MAASMWPRLSEKMDPATILKLIVKFATDKLIVFIAAIYGTPILAFIWVQCLLYRAFVAIVAKLFRKDLGPMLGRMSTILAEEDPHGDRINCSIVTVLRIDGNLTLPQVKKLFHENIICAKVDNAPKYPELQQYPVDFMGHSFWKRDTTFCLDNHISEYKYTSMMIPVSKIHQYMLNRKFARERSLWQLTIFRNRHSNTTYLALRMQHCIGDARSVVKLFAESLGNKKLTTKEPNFTRRTISDKIKFLVSLPLDIARFNLYILKCIWKSSEHPWGQPESVMTLKENSTLFVGISEKISLEKIKNIGRICGVQGSAVIMSAVIGAVEKFVQMRYRHNSESLSIYLALPKQDHPEKLANQFYISIPTIPHVDSDIQRVKTCNRIYKYMRESNHCRHSSMISDFLVDFPASFRHKIGKHLRVVTTGLSNIAGEQEGFSVNGFPCSAFNMSASIIQASAVNFTVVSYKEGIQVGVVAKESTLTERETVTLARLVEKEFIGLGQLLLG